MYTCVSFRVITVGLQVLHRSVAGAIRSVVVHREACQ